MLRAEALQPKIELGHAYIACYDVYRAKQDEIKDPYELFSLGYRAAFDAMNAVIDDGELIVGKARTPFLDGEEERFNTEYKEIREQLEVYRGQS